MSTVSAEQAMSSEQILKLSKDDYLYIPGNDLSFAICIAMKNDIRFQLKKAEKVELEKPDGSTVVMKHVRCDDVSILFDRPIKLSIAGKTSVSLKVFARVMKVLNLLDDIEELNITDIHVLDKLLFHCEIFISEQAEPSKNFPVLVVPDEPGRKYFAVIAPLVEG